MKKRLVGALGLPKPTDQTSEKVGPKEKKFRAAIIGFGNQMEKDIVPALKELKDDIIIEAICDVDKIRIEKALSFFPQASPYRNFRILLKNQSRINFLILCLPHNQYYSFSKRAIISQIPVFKEKPLTKSLQEGISLQRLAAKFHTPVFVMEQRRYSENYLTGKKILKLIVKPYMFEAKYLIPTGTIYKGWRANKRQAGGGVILDMGYHMIDIIIWFFGLPEKVWCVVSNKGIAGFKYTVEDSASLLLSYPNGLHGVLQLACLVGPKEEKVRVYGRNGSLEIFDNHVILRNSLGKTLKTYPTGRNSIEETKKATLAFISGTKNCSRGFLSNIDEHLFHMAFIEAAYQSLKTNTGVDPKIFLGNL